MPRKKKIGGNGQTNGAESVAESEKIEAPAKRKRPVRRKAAAASPPVSDKIDTPAAEINDDAIRLRAYFIAEERLRRSLPGDPESDWIEARRQLLAERGAA